MAIWRGTTGTKGKKQRNSSERCHYDLDAKSIVGSSDVVGQDTQSDLRFYLSCLVVASDLYRQGFCLNQPNGGDLRERCPYRLLYMDQRPYSNCWAATYRG